MHFGSLVDCGFADSRIGRIAANADASRPASAPSSSSRLWPLTALGAWASCWAVFIALRHANTPPAAALAAGVALGAALALAGQTPWRRRLLAAGFPASVLASGAIAGLPAWTWLLPLALLALLYPLHSWRDAPLFPTPQAALDGLAEAAPLQAGDAVLDAGCGLGHGLAALRRAYPQARLHGIESSWPIAAWARRSHHDASAEGDVRRADMWAEPWESYQMIYLFQRPESMPRAVAKAERELKAGAWLASLEFEARDLKPQATVRCPDGRSVWLYQAPLVARETSSEPATVSPFTTSAARIEPAPSSSIRPSRKNGHRRRP